MCGASISLEHILQTGNFSVSAWALGGQETGELAEQVGYGRLPEKKHFPQGHFYPRHLPF